MIFNFRDYALYEVNIAYNKETRPINHIRTSLASRDIRISESHELPLDVLLNTFKSPTVPPTRDSLDEEILSEHLTIQTRHFSDQSPNDKTFKSVRRTEFKHLHTYTKSVRRVLRASSIHIPDESVIDRVFGVAVQTISVYACSKHTHTSR
ncbi:hypothetical protein CRM22_000426 [Opisthorchis felineus]|uniref:Uncharacterized protein n=1 Tax=Opisthorchis felineus TaxID=147828 RepID=A0A4V3SH93_OPIFE|nr:hypothetical protein CRM22_000426 [Opisthorchis felineus]